MSTPAVTANALYLYPHPKVGLRIGTGGSGQSGLLQALAEGFIKFCNPKNEEDNFSIEWYTSDTSVTIDYLAREVVDVGITYHGIAEATALAAGFVDRVEYAFRDHWQLVGPKSDPANLRNDGTTYVFELFTKLFSALEANKNSKTPIKFLSRYDKSACNITESAIWANIGQTPWATPSSTWYHMLGDFPFQALRAAAELGEYTLTDRGTWCAVEQSVRDKLEIFAVGKDDENDILLNPAHVLVGTKAKNKDLANKFVDWIISDAGGQAIVKGFQKNGMDLYTTIPHGVDPLGKAKAALKGQLNTPPVRAAVNHPNSADELYFFKNDKYVRVNSVNDTISYTKEKYIYDMWSTLYETGMAPVDAILRVPGTDDEAWFFQGRRLARVDIPHNKLAFEGHPQDWAKKWPALKDAGFTAVDAALPWKIEGNNNAAYFFSGEDCVCIDLESGSAVHGVEKIVHRFKSLAKARFFSVDAVAFKPRTNEKEAYFFSGDNYLNVDLAGDFASGYTEPKNMHSYWNCLAKANFY